MNVKIFFFLFSLLITTACKAQIDSTSYWDKVLSGPNITLLYDTSSTIILEGTTMVLDTPVIEPVLFTTIYTKGTVVYKYNNELVIEYVDASFYLYDNGTYEALFFVPVPGSLNEYQFLTEKDILKFKQHDNTR